MLSVRGLTKQYNGRIVVDHLGFDLQPGTVTAFLGPNGAGKSTTLRMICGLTAPSGGGALIAGRTFRSWPNPSHVAGVLLDASAVHPGRQARSHLRTVASLAGVSTHRVDEVLMMVGLSDAANRKIGKYSLGMRQRLGLAQALLTDPPLLVLDEPINGLDPDGIRAIRNLLRSHAARGGTVLLSSHVLSEVDQTADRVLMIGNGRVLADGTLRELTATQRCLVRAPDMRRLTEVLQAAGVPLQQATDGYVSAHTTVEHASNVTFAAGVQLTGLREEPMSVEDLFFQLAGTTTSTGVMA